MNSVMAFDLVVIHLTEVLMPGEDAGACCCCQNDILRHN